MMLLRDPVAYATICILATIVASAMAGFALRMRRKAAGLALGLCALAIAEWSFCCAGEALAPDIPSKIWWAKVGYFGTISVVPLVFLFSLHFTHPEIKLKRLHWIVLWSIPVLTWVMMFTNHWHYLLWSSFTLLPGESILAYGHGPWYWTLIVYVYVVLSIATYLLVRFALRYRHVHRQQSIVLLLAIGLPWLADAVYITGLSHDRDLAPVGFALSASLLLWSFARLQFLDLIPVARDLVIEEMPDGIVVLDALGRIVDLNPAAQTLVGPAITSAVGKHYEEVFHRWPNLVRGLGDVSTQHNEVRLDNDTWIEVSSSPFSGPMAQAGGRVITARDVTARKKMQASLLHAEKMEAVAQLSAGLAHDFNNLLTSINGFAELLQRELPPGTSSYRMAGTILRSGIKSAELVNELQAFSLRQMVTPQELNINTILNVLANEQDDLFDDSVSLQMHLYPELWTVKADPGQVEQIVLYLAKHAKDVLTVDGHVCVRTRNVTLDAPLETQSGEVVEGNYVLLTMSFSGACLSEEQASHIFEPFYFASNDVADGIGLRLAAVYGIVRQNEGHIYVECLNNQNLTFQVYLPRYSLFGE